MKSLILLFTILLCYNVNAQSLPDFVLIGLNGDTLSRKGLLGKNVYINVFETWCKPCASEVPLLNATSEKLGDVLVIAITPAKTSKAVRFKEKFGLQIPIYPNASELCKELGATQYPSHLFIDKNGKTKYLRVLLGVKLPNNQPRPSNKEMIRLMLEQNQTTIPDAIIKAKESSVSKK